MEVKVTWNTGDPVLTFETPWTVALQAPHYFVLYLIIFFYYLYPLLWNSRL